MIRCLYEGLKRECNQEAATWMATFLLKAWQKELRDVGCYLHMPEADAKQIAKQHHHHSGLPSKGLKNQSCEWLIMS